MRERERLAKQRIVEQINLADREVIRGAPVRVHAAQFVRRERLVVHRAILLETASQLRFGTTSSRPPATIAAMLTQTGISTVLFSRAVATTD